MKCLVFDCPSGISGDMTLGALVDLGVPLERLRAALATLPLQGYRLEQEAVTRNGIAATHVRVVLDEHTEHPHRHLRHVLEILRGGDLPARALSWSEQVFTRLAEAEASVHRTTIEKVHFHEVGAVDAIVDIAGVCVGLDWLCEQHGVEGFRASQIRVGRGTTRSEHGTIPVPPPATLHLLHGWPLQFSTSEGERVTPTGAALLAALAQPLDGRAVRVAKTGYGAGTREYADAPNVLRVLLCDVAEATAAITSQAAAAAGSQAGAESQAGAGSQAAGAVEPAWESRTGRIGVLNTTIDDMVPEFYGHLQTRLFAEGARDVYFTPIYMKKSRPATQVTVIAEPEHVRRLAGVLLNESSTLGVRIAYEERLELPRRLGRVATRFGEVQVKITVKPDGRVRHFPEYESVRRAAEAAGVPLEDVYRAALGAEVVEDDGTKKDS